MIWNFVHIAESLPFDEKTKFGVPMMECSEECVTDLWL